MNKLPTQEDRELYEKRHKQVLNIYGPDNHTQPSLDHMSIQFKSELYDEKIYNSLPSSPTNQKINEIIQNKVVPEKENKYNHIKNNIIEINSTNKNNDNNNNNDDSNNNSLKIEMNVSLEGENILEGLKQLSKIGIASEVNNSLVKCIFYSYNQALSIFSGIKITNIFNQYEKLKAK